jgi:hypothetical protein
VPGPQALPVGGTAARTPGVGTCSARYINAGATVGFCLVMSLKYTAPVGTGAVMPPGPPGAGLGQPRLLEHVSVAKVFVSRTASSTLVTTSWSGEMPSMLSGARVQGPSSLSLLPRDRATGGKYRWTGAGGAAQQPAPKPVRP